MKTRLINTSFYDSERVLSLSKDSRWLFMYYITNKGIGLTGAYKWSKSKTLFETGLTPKEHEKSCLDLESSKLVFFVNEWIVVPETQEKTGYDKGAKTSIGYQKEFEELPEVVKEILVNCEYPIDTLSEKEDGVYIPPETINHKTENINSLKGGKGGKLSLKTKKYSSIHDLDESDVLEISQRYSVPVAFVESKVDDMLNWHESTGKVRKNWKATLANWVKRDALEINLKGSDVNRKRGIDASHLG